MKTKLTDTIIKNVKPLLKRQQMADGGGLTLYIEPNGSKIWHYRYRYDKKSSMVSLGNYPTVSLKDARIARDEFETLLKSGINPSQAKREAKFLQSNIIQNTFEKVAQAWWEHWRIGLTEKHASSTLSRLEANVFPAIGKRPMESISTPLLVSVIKEITKRGAYDIAKRALETCGQIFRYAVQHGVCQNNPTANIKPSEIIPSRKAQNQIRVDIKDLPQLLRSIDAYDDVDDIHGATITRIALQLMALTFVRTKELIQAEWSEIDFEKRWWKIPRERMKMDTPHLVPLARQLSSAV